MTRQAPPVPLFRLDGIRAIEAYYVRDAKPSLMERAGAAAAQVALEMLGEHEGPVLVACGPGNNGGDGFVLARHLLHAGCEVSVAFAGDAAKLPADAREAHGEWLDAGGHCVPDIPQGEFALAVDALFGIGLARPIERRHAEWIALLNALDCPILALDMPSGLDVDTGRAFGPCVRAAHTATFIAIKPGLLTLDGPAHAGEVPLCNLDLDYADRCASPGCVNGPALFGAHLVPRPKNSHKGLNGNAVVLGGAAGMTGAALLAGRAALRLGAGRVFVGLLEQGLPNVDPVQPELMLRPAQDAISLAGVLAVGPGLGQTDAALELLRHAIEADAPLVLDADALNLLAQHPVLAGRLRRRPLPTILTPHPAEAARLIGCNTNAIQQDRIASALELAQRFNACVVLKGCGSVLAAPDGHWAINPTGNAGMASAGMGDVLTGMVAALLAQGWDAWPALTGAVWLHGDAADRLVDDGIGPIGLAAGELIDEARRALNQLIESFHSRSA